MADYNAFSEIWDGYDPGATIAADDSFTLFTAPYDGRVSACSFLPEAAATGDNTNARTYTLVNKGQNGGGSTVMATLALTTGVNLVAFDEKAATLSVVANAINFVKDDVIAWVSTHTGTGVVDPGGKVKVSIQRLQA